MFQEDVSGRTCEFEGVGACGWPLVPERNYRVLGSRSNASLKSTKENRP